MCKVKEFIHDEIEAVKPVADALAAQYETALLSNPKLADLILCGISVEEVATFVRHTAPTETSIGTLLANPCLHKLIAVEQLLKDEDEFCRAWKYDERLGAWKKKNNTS